MYAFNANVSPLPIKGGRGSHFQRFRIWRRFGHFCLGSSSTLLCVSCLGSPLLRLLHLCICHWWFVQLSLLVCPLIVQSSDIVFVLKGIYCFAPSISLLLLSLWLTRSCHIVIKPYFIKGPFALESNTYLFLQPISFVFSFFLSFFLSSLSSPCTFGRLVTRERQSSSRRSPVLVTWG